MNYIIIISLILLTSQLAFANEDRLSEDEYRLMDSMSFEELLETELSTGMPMKQRFVPSITSILTSEEIVKSGARTLHEVLEQVPGLHIYPSDLDLMSEKISIRGIQTGFSPQVLFLMDGVSLNDLLHGHPGFVFKMPISIIHRIEVIRGPGSAMHGADAFSGVVNIISKKHEDIIDQIGVRYGSFNTWEAWTNQSVHTETFSLGLSLSLMKSEGDDGRIIQADALSSTANSAFSLAPGPASTGYDTAYLHADISYKDIAANLLIERSRDLGVGAGHLRILDSRGYVDRDKVLTDIQHTGNDWLKDTVVKTRAYFSYLDSQANYYAMPDGVTVEGVTYPDGRQGKPYAKEYMAGLSSNAIYRGLDKHALNVAVGYKYAKLDPSQVKNFNNGGFNGTLTDVTDDPNLTYMLEHTRTNIYVSLQDIYAIDDDLDFTAGVRYDYYDDFRSAFNPRLALVWQQHNNLTIKAMYGRAFRAPSFGELYEINNPKLVGNPDLKPETIDTYEIAINHREKLHTRVNIFYYQAKDLIDYVYDPLTLKSYAKNVKDQTGYGAELELEYGISDSIGLRGNYAYQHSKDSDTKERVANAPVHQAFAQIEYKPSRYWNANVQYFYIGKRYRESTDPRDPVDADSLVNLTIERRDIFKGLDALVSARNLFDRDYREPSSISIPNDYPMQGLSLFAELRYKF